MSLSNTIRFIASHPLNKRKKIGSIIRFASWQLKSRVKKGPFVFDWLNGSKFLVKSGDTGLTGNIYTGLHEFSDMGFLLHFLRSDDFFVDVGANAGSYTVLACAVVGAEGMAFEPSPASYSRLLDNISINNLDNRVECLNVGVSDRDGFIKFTEGRDTTNHALADGEECEISITVPVEGLDTALSGRSPSLIKIDVEGLETLVINGAENVLQSDFLKAVIMELNGSGNRYGYDENEILSLMLKSGFSTYSYNPIGRKLESLGGKNCSSGNTIFIKDVQYVEDRLSSSQKFVFNDTQF